MEGDGHLGSVMLAINRLEAGGGTETHIFTLAKQLQRLKYTVGVFTSGGPWVSFFRQKGIRVYVCRTFNPGTLVSLMRDKNYRILHVHDSEGFKLASALTKTSKIPIIMTVHGLYVAPQVIRACAKTSKSIIAVSSEVERYVRYYCGVPIDKIHTVLNGISMNTFKSLNFQTARTKFHVSENSFSIGYAGRFTLEKANISRRICNIVQNFANNEKHTQVLVAGRNSKQYAGKHNVTALGHVKDMPSFYNACSVVVGTGRVAIEALSCNVPTIAVGSAGFIGLISSHNLDAAIQTNFGDHRRFGTLWYDEVLANDLKRMQQDIDGIRRETEKINQQIRVQFAAARMVQTIHAIYRVWT